MIVSLNAMFSGSHIEDASVQQQGASTSISFPDQVLKLVGWCCEHIHMKNWEHRNPGVCQMCWSAPSANAPKTKPAMIESLTALLAEANAAAPCVAKDDRARTRIIAEICSYNLNFTDLRPKDVEQCLKISP